jgi:hypothetical protein
MPGDGVGQIPPPCVFLLPRGVPTADEPSPRLARLDEVRFITAMLNLTGTKEAAWDVHVKRVGIEIYRKDSTQYKSVPMRRVTVYQGDTVLEQKDIKITRGEHVFRGATPARQAQLVT